MGAHRTDETEGERLDRELGQLLNETRVAMPGVQVLFAFLLTVPFAAGYGRMTGFEKDVYLVALLASALASAFFIAPSAYHRLLFRRGEKARLVRLASVSVIVGLAFLAVAMNAAILLVLDVVSSTGTAIAVTVVTSLIFAGLWFGVALSRRVEE
jgi:O-antigen/teichoic acid export membrane protein